MYERYVKRETLKKSPKDVIDTIQALPSTTMSVKMMLKHMLL